MSEWEARRKEELFARALLALRAMANPCAGDLRAFWVPGRIEFLGKHTDYAGGRSLLCAAERGFCVIAGPRADSRVRVSNARTAAAVVTELRPDIPASVGHWSSYPLAVARRVARNFAGPLRGADIAFVSDLPPAAGMSSSSALVVATFLALAEINNLASRPEYLAAIHGTEDLAGYLSTIENGQGYGTLAGDIGVGTAGGSEDHTAILCAQAGMLVQYRFCPVQFERQMPVPAGYVFVVAVSGIVAEKTGSARAAYNRASKAIGEILERWRAATGRSDRYAATAVAAFPDGADRLRAVLRADLDDGPLHELLLNRLEHFLVENYNIIPAAGNALARGELERVGRLVDRSQATAEKLLGNQVPETIALARQARELGAVAASTFGAGFGGSVWALVPAVEADNFRARWAGAYARSFPGLAQSGFFITGAGPAAMTLPIAFSI